MEGQGISAYNVFQSKNIPCCHIQFPWHVSQHSNIVCNHIVKSIYLQLEQ